MRTRDEEPLDGNKLPDGSFAELAEAGTRLFRQGLRFATVFVEGLVGLAEDELAKLTKENDDAHR